MLSGTTTHRKRLCMQGHYRRRHRANSSSVSNPCFGGFVVPNPVVQLDLCKPAQWLGERTTRRSLRGLRQTCCKRCNLYKFSTRCKYWTIGPNALCIIPELLRRFPHYILLVLRRQRHANTGILTSVLKPMFRRSVAGLILTLLYKPDRWSITEYYTETTEASSWWMSLGVLFIHNDTSSDIPP